MHPYAIAWGLWGIAALLGLGAVLLRDLPLGNRFLLLMAAILFLMGGFGAAKIARLFQL